MSETNHAANDLDGTTPRIIYGPVNSRRFGKSLGINISGPGKYCSYNCIYCFRGFNQGRPGDKTANLPGLNDVTQALEAYSNSHDLSALDDITLAGNGEPTDNPALPDFLQYLHTFRNNRCSHVKLSMLTNGMGFVGSVNGEFERLLESVRLLDRVCVKLDAGNPDIWKRLNCPTAGIGFDEWLRAVAKVPGLTLQTMFIQGRVDNTAEEELESLAACMRLLKPKGVYFVTIDKSPADKGILPVDAEEMARIKRSILSKVDIDILF